MMMSTLVCVFSREAMQRMSAPYCYAAVASLLGGSSQPMHEMKIAEEQTVLIWIQLPGLPVNLWNKYSFQSMAKSLHGVFVVSDQFTRKREKLSFATIQLEVPVIIHPRPSIKLDMGEGRVVNQEVVYESHIVYCARCGALTHLAANCRQKSGESLIHLGKEDSPDKNLIAQDGKSCPLSVPSHGTSGTNPIPLASNPFEKISIANEKEWMHGVDFPPGFSFLAGAERNTGVLVGVENTSQPPNSQNQLGSPVSGVWVDYLLSSARLLGGGSLYPSKWGFITDGRREIIYEAWETVHYGCPILRVLGKLSAVKKRLSRWNREEFGRIDEKVKSLHVKLEQSQAANDQGNLFATLEETAIRQELNRALLLEEIMWRNKSKV
ncbi:hypothetical protein EJ110_NYTH44431 [Nymphaea thermarum]|nr:hypothetical protein EJ110_NYTH44431 [Nymphaea thermarum]